uniref:Nanos homolog 1 n=1 Tax=Leptobrachium leishanense TaxID=445787 RepID=A0A8C5Q7I4_9ANUR
LRTGLCKGSFEMWKDYLQLALLVQEMAKNRVTETSESPPSKNGLVPAPNNTNATANCNGYPSDGEPNSSITDGQANPPDGMCNFCKHNGESRSVYTSHALKGPDGEVMCPVLRNYVCPQCGATGDSSHTLRYCPLSESKRCLYKRRGRNSVGRRLRR